MTSNIPAFIWALTRSQKSPRTLGSKWYFGLLLLVLFHVIWSSGICLHELGAIPAELITVFSQNARCKQLSQLRGTDTFHLQTGQALSDHIAHNSIVFRDMYLQCPVFQREA